MPAPPGNTNAAKENRLFSDALRRAIAQDDAKRLRAGIEVLLDMAGEGNLDALEFLADRTDGKPRQQIDADVRTMVVKLDPPDADA